MSDKSENGMSEVKILLGGLQRVVTAADAFLFDYDRLKADYIGMRASRDRINKENKRMRKLIRKVHKAVN